MIKISEHFPGKLPHREQADQPGRQDVQVDRRNPSAVRRRRRQPQVRRSRSPGHHR